MKEHKQFFEDKDGMHISRGTFLSRFFTAVLLIGAGGLLIAERTGYLSNELFRNLFNWQMLLIGIGLILISKKNGSFVGAIVILVGLVFLIPVYFNVPVNTSQLLWPAILVGIGIIVLFNGFGKCGKSFKSKFHHQEISDIDMVDGNHIFGGGEHFVTSDNFKGGRINAIFGGGVYDLTKCKLAAGTNVLEVNFIFGGVEFLVPSSWNIKVEVDSIMGGFSNKQGIYKQDEATEGVLIIRGSAIFGGGELKRF
ncbi:MAG: hypothetical protein JXR34_02600 [Bacteroidales bacterium]|nr:hypothetical protein [Bacteroidales bacterium]